MVGKPADPALRKVQVRSPLWYIKKASFVDELMDQVTVYVWIGKEDASKPVRYFIARNHDLAAHVHFPSGWRENAFMRLKSVEAYENRWDILFGAN